MRPEEPVILWFRDAISEDNLREVRSWYIPRVGELVIIEGEDRVITRIRWVFRTKESLDLVLNNPPIVEFMTVLTRPFFHPYVVE